MPMPTHPHRFARTVAILAIAAGAVSLAVPASATPPVPQSVATAVSAGTDMWTTATELGLRSGPSGGYPVTVTALEDTHVRATGDESDGWLKVRIGGTYAWTPARFLTVVKPAWDPRRIWVTATELGLRSGPLGTYPVSVWAHRGDPGFYSGVMRNDGWWQVKVNGVYAWTPARFLSSSYVAASGSAPAPEPAPEPEPESGAYTGPVWVDATELGLRSGPSNSSPVTVTARRDARGVATGDTSNGWAEVRIGDVDAWTPAAFLTTSEPSWNPSRVAVTSPELGLRAGPSNSDPVKVTARRGDVGYFTGAIRKGWWQVKINGKYAWTPGQLLSVGGLYDRERLLDVGHSQVGYREPSWRNNKYNDWINGDNAWCAVFVAWEFHHAGYAAGVPRTKHFDDYVSRLRASGVLDTNVSASDLKRGNVVLIDWYPRNGPTHTGVVDHVSGDYVWLVEGNTTSGTGDSTRGVFYRKRAIVDMHAVYDPQDYARATATG